MSYCQRHSNRKAKCGCMALCHECRLSFSSDCNCKDKPEPIEELPKLTIVIPTTPAPPNSPKSSIETKEIEEDNEDVIPELETIKRANNIELRNLYSVSTADIVSKLEDINENIAIIDEIKATEAIKQADEMVNKLNHRYEERMNVICEDYNNKLHEMELEKTRIEKELELAREKMKSVAIIEDNTKKITELKKKASAKKKEEKFARLSRGESALATLLPKQSKRS